MWVRNNRSSRMFLIPSVVIVLPTPAPLPVMVASSNIDLFVISNFTLYKTDSHNNKYKISNDANLLVVIACQQVNNHQGRIKRGPWYTHLPIKITMTKLNCHWFETKESLNNGEMPAIVRNRELNVCAYPTQEEIDLIPFYSLQTVKP